MKPISLMRFNALAGYARMPMARVTAEEIAWFDHADGRVVGAVIRDRSDNDFGGLVFAHDEKLRFRATDVTTFEPTRRRAEVPLRRAMERAAMEPPEKHHQGDEKGAPVDFFGYVRPREQLNPSFVGLAESEAYSPARHIIEPMMRWYDDVDGNFVEQFQTTGFDQRIWELYLFATFIEAGYLLDRSKPIPDFSCSGLRGEFSVEAVTVGPTRDGSAIVAPPPLDSPEAAKNFLRHYMPIKFGSALFSKLRKAYWKQPHVAGKPFLLAIEDFSSPASMTYTRSALETYLYGYTYDWEHNADGALEITPEKIEEHRWGEKVIPSGFFDLPGAENVSAVVFSNSGTIAKFNRMGLLAGFGSSRVLMVRRGTHVDHDPNASAPKTFTKIVNAPGYNESWVEGLDVFHNQKAKIAFPEYGIPGAAHHYIEETGRLRSFTPDWHPLGSFTRHFAPVKVEQELQNLSLSPEADLLGIKAGDDSRSSGW